MIPQDQKTFRIGGDYWYWVAQSTGTTAATALSTGVQYFLPVRIDQVCRVISIGLEATATAATAIARVGIYADAGVHYPRPGALITAFGSLDVSAAGFPNTSSTYADIVAPGVYWFSVVNQTAAATVRTSTGYVPDVRIFHGTTEPAAALAAPVGYTQSSITGALADVSSTASLSSATVVPALYFQID